MPEVTKVRRLYYLFQTGFSLLLWVPIFYSYQLQSGLSEAQYFQIQSYYYLIFCFFEIPTGYISDRWGHKKSLVAASVLMVLTHFAAIFWVSFIGFFTHFALIALARSLISGAASAYLYEFLDSRGFAPEYQVIEGKARSYSLIARIVGWTAAGYLFSVNATLPYWGTAAAMMLALFAAIRLPSNPSIELASDSANSSDLIRDGNSASPKESKSESSLSIELKKGASVILQLFSSNRRLLYLMLSGVGLFVLVRMSQVNLYQPIMKSKGFNASAFGWVMAAMTAFEALGSYHGHRLVKYLQGLSIVSYSTLLSSVALTLVALASESFTVVLFLIFSLGAGISFPLLRQKINDAITVKKMRATILSFESIVDRALCGVAAYFASVSVKQNQLEGFLISISVISAVLVILSIGAAKKYEAPRVP